MAQKDMRLIGNIYRIGQVMSSSNILMTCTAYHRYTNDVVGLYVIGLPMSAHIPFVQQTLQPLTLRQDLHSPHVLQVHDFGIDGARAYIATDPPRGVTLRYVLDTDNVDLQRALEIAQQVARGMQVLHEKQIHTLDLRPSLITVDTPGEVDRAQIDDIGLRRILMRLGYTHNQPGNEIGYLDPRYAPPEYINREESGPWSDTYQLGLLFFELVTGRPPFVGLNPAETGIMQSSEPVPRMSQYNHETPSAFQEFVEHALQKDPQQRYANATEQLDALMQLHAPRPAWQQQKADVHLSGVGLTREIPLVGSDETLKAIPPDATGTIDKNSVETPSSAEIYAYLCFEQDGKVLQRFPLTRPVSIIGRLDPRRNLSPDVDLTDLDPKMTISRQHARIRFEKTFFYLEDLKSRNKTRLGELTLVPLKAEILQHGDVIFIGKVRLRFEVPGMTRMYVFKEHH